MKYTSFILFILFLAACAEKPDDFTFEQGYDYFPLEADKYWEYQVDSIIYDPDVNGTRKDTIKSWHREVITEVFQDAQGNDVYRVERLERNHPEDPWEITRVFTLERNDDFAYRIENNLRLIQLTFPIQSTNDWTATLHFDPQTVFFVAGESIRIYKDWDSEIETVGEREQIGDFTFEEVTTVIHENSDDNPFERRRVVEKYAKGVGLVAREMMILDSQYCNEDPPPADCNTISWEEKGEKGFELRQVVLEHN